MRPIVLVALLIPLMGAALHAMPTADACTPPVCRLQDCVIFLERPSVDPRSGDVDLGLVGAACGDGGGG